MSRYPWALLQRRLRLQEFTREKRGGVGGGRIVWQGDRDSESYAGGRLSIRYDKITWSGGRTRYKGKPGTSNRWIYIAVVVVVVIIILLQCDSCVEMI